MKNNPTITDIIKMIRQTILKPILMLLLSMSCFDILILEEGGSRRAQKKLNSIITNAMVRTTINKPKIMSCLPMSYFSRFILATSHWQPIQLIQSSSDEQYDYY